MLRNSHWQYPGTMCDSGSMECANDVWNMANSTSNEGDEEDEDI